MPIDPRYERNGQPPPSLFRLFSWMAVPPVAAYRLYRAGYLDDVARVVAGACVDTAAECGRLAWAVIEDVLDGPDKPKEGG